MKNKISTILVLCLAIIGSISNVNAQTKMASLVGTWTLNEEKCDFGRLTAASASKLKTLYVEQTVQAITVASGDSTTKTSVIISLDGKPSEQATSTVIYGIPNTLKCNIDVQIQNNRSFITTVTNDPLGMATKSVKTYALSDDGETLTIEFKNDYGQQTIAGKLVYDKKHI